MDRHDVQRWIDGYEKAWRTPGTEPLADLFTADVSYLPSPWAARLNGVDEVGTFWEAEREGPDEPFAMDCEIVAVDSEARIGVARVAVAYLRPNGGRWRDLWLMRFDADGRCEAFEEWPFAPDQNDGH